MSDAILKNTFNRVNPAYELLADTTVGTATTNVDFSSLSYGKDDELMLVSTIYSVIGTSVAFSLLYNANYTATNYWRERMESSGTSTTGERANDAVFSFVNGARRNVSVSKIKLANNGYIVQQTNTTREIAGNTLMLNDHYGATTFTATSITSIRIASSGANGIGIGSRFQLYRLKAKVMFDLTLASTANIVNIPDLTIDKGSEYMLVSTLVSVANTPHLIHFNGNNTNTNYYAQRVAAYGTTMNGERQNSPWFSLGLSSGVGTFARTYIKLNNSGYITYQSDVNRGLNNIVELHKYYGSSTFTTTSITSIRLFIDAGFPFGIGSRFTLYKMK